MEALQSDRDGDGIRDGDDPLPNVKNEPGASDNTYAYHHYTRHSGRLIYCPHFHNVARQRVEEHSKCTVWC